MNRSVLVVGGLVAVALTLGAACDPPQKAPPGSDSGVDPVTLDAATGSTDSGAETADSGDSALPTPSKITLRGKTYAPNGTLPLSGVLVYQTDSLPAPIPDAAYCDLCRPLPVGTFALSAADGSFELMAEAGTHYLVTEKGQFRRVRMIIVDADGGMQDVASALTTLPGASLVSADGQNDTIPRIALMNEPTPADNDAPQIALAALGVTSWTSFSNDVGLVNEENLRKYHTVMFPCDAGSAIHPGSSEHEAVRAYVQAGGKVFASDWSHGFVDGAFREFFKAANSVWTAETGPQAPAGRYDDEALKAWLANVAPGEDPSSTHFEGIWSSYNGVQAAEVPSASAGTHTVAPHVYATITDTNPRYRSPEAATSLEFGCGRALLSTFHMHDSPSSSSNATQEKALLHMLLDVSTCIGEPGKGPPSN